jgi:hypothetical protein
MLYQSIVRVVVVVSLMIVGVGCDRTGIHDVPPLRLKFDLGEPGVELNSNFRVLEHRNYSIGFELVVNANSNIERERIRRSIAEISSKGKQLPIEIHLTMVAINSGAEVKVSEKTYSELRLIAWGGSTINIEMDQIKLLPGDYRLSLINMNPVVQFRAIPTHFVVAEYPKSSAIEK